MTTTTRYIGSLEEIATTGATTTTTAYYGALALSVNGALSYTLADGLGSVSEAVNASTGAVTATQLYAPYGAVRYASGSLPGSHGFTGQVSDAATSGLDYYGARYYDPAAGQFTSADSMLPKQGATPDPGQLNRYTYVAGNPETKTDPTGHRYDLGWGEVANTASVLQTIGLTLARVELALSAYKKANAWREYKDAANDLQSSTRRMQVGRRATKAERDALADERNAKLKQIDESDDLWSTASDAAETVGTALLVIGWGVDAWQSGQRQWEHDGQYGAPERIARAAAAGAAHATVDTGAAIAGAEVGAIAGGVVFAVAFALVGSLFGPGGTVAGLEIGWQVGQVVGAAVGACWATNNTTISAEANDDASMVASWF